MVVRCSVLGFWGIPRREVEHGAEGEEQGDGVQGHDDGVGRQWQHP